MQNATRVNTNLQSIIKTCFYKIVFLHKVVKGEEQNSFGAEVAQLSGLPEVIIQKAKRIMKERESHESH